MPQFPLRRLPSRLDQTGGRGGRGGAGDYQQGKKGCHGGTNGKEEVGGNASMPLPGWSCRLSGHGKAEQPDSRHPNARARLQQQVPPEAGSQRVGAGHQGCQATCQQQPLPPSCIAQLTPSLNSNTAQTWLQGRPFVRPTICTGMQYYAGYSPKPLALRPTQHYTPQQANAVQSKSWAQRNRVMQ